MARKRYNDEDVRRQIIWDTRAVRRMDALVQFEIDYAACF